MLANNVDQNQFDVMDDFSQLLQAYTFKPPQVGEIVSGEILTIGPDLILLDIGANRDAVVSPTELKSLDRDFFDSLSAGDEIPVYVVNTTTDSGSLEVSVIRGLEQQEWLNVQALLTNDETCTAEYIGYNKGGMIVQFGHLRGFVPVSHVPSLLNIADVRKLQAQKAKLVGEKCEFKVIEVNQEADRLLFSERKAQEEHNLARLETLSVGDIVTGIVTGVKKYGVFLDLGSGIRGLVHVSELAWEFIDHPSDLDVKRGDEIEARIEIVDLEKQRVSLSRKAILPTPWQQFSEKYVEKQVIEGVVSSIAPFGVFVKVISGIEGLVHESELIEGGQPVVGETVLVVVTSMDYEQEQVGLSMKQVSAEDQIAWMQARSEAEEEASDDVDPTAEAPLTQPFSEDGLDGQVHVNGQGSYDEMAYTNGNTAVMN